MPRAVKADCDVAAGYGYALGDGELEGFGIAEVFFNTPGVRPTGGGRWQLNRSQGLNGQ